MAEAFLQLPDDERRDALGVAASASGRPEHLLEKDVWVVWSLATLFNASFAKHLVFKGGTSLSKAYGAIDRFSEDVDLTYDIRELIPELVEGNEEALPATRSQEKKWSKAVRDKLPEWVENKVAPTLTEALKSDGISADLRIEGDKLFIDYKPLATGSGYVSPSVMLEFGARSTGEPATPRDIVCDAAQYIDGLAFPVATPRTMCVERTFWEKATAAHVYCHQGQLRGDRFARHWYDLARLNNAGYADTALKDRGLANDVARHKNMFFSMKDAEGALIDYTAAVSGGLVLVPEGKPFEALSTDYAKMIEDGLLLNDPDPFEDLMNECQAIADKANLKLA